MSGAELTGSLRPELEPHRQEMVDLLRELVSIESPSDDRPSLDRFAARLESLFGELGEIERIDPTDPERGAHLRLTLDGQNGVGSSRVDLQACKLEYSIVSPK